MPPTISTVFYNVSVRDGAAFAAYLARVYDVGRLRAAKFDLVHTSFDDSQFTIHASRQATFQEELRVTGRASDSIDGNDVNGIEEKMHEAYGARAAVEVEPLKLAERRSR